LILTITEENYLKAILKLTIDKGEKVATNAISAEMSTTAASVTDMLKKLAEKKLITYEKYYGVRLSKSGEQVAKSLVRKHRLWEVFLVEKLGFAWDEVHDMAEQLEHVRSDELVLRLEKYLGNPKFDPHGDPIPDEKGNMQERKQIALSDMQPGQKGVVVGVKDTAAAFLKFLDSLSISLGTGIQVKEKIQYDQSILLKLASGKELMLSKQVGDNLFIRPK
jgi:DtxR family Mn-dependent transcriptional regulator